MNADEKAPELFLKYYRICGDFDESIEATIKLCDKFIEAGEDEVYWNEVKEETYKIEK